MRRPLFVVIAIIAQMPESPISARFAPAGLGVLLTSLWDPYRPGLHLAPNLVSRWLIERKQGLPLGESTKDFDL